MLYLDSSALVKLVVREAESDALFSFLETRAQPLVSSVLARVEVVRSVQRAGGSPAVEERANAVVDRVALIKVDPGVLENACELAPADLRTLDAIHLATALSLGDDLLGLVSYDHRLNRVAADLGLTIHVPAPL